MSNPSIGPKFWAWSNILGIDKGNKFQPSKKNQKTMKLKILGNVQSFYWSKLLGMVKTFLTFK